MINNGICVQHDYGQLTTSTALIDVSGTDLTIKKVMVLLKTHVHVYYLKLHTNNWM
jgi:hypothetical protein